VSKRHGSKSRKARDEDAPEEKEQQGGMLGLMRDVGIAILVVVLVIGLIFAYTRVWPPLVVIESSSMSHHPDESSVGVIDAGDLVLVKKVTERSDIITWAEGEQSGYMKYGDYGDVIVYRKNGYDGATPVIHRAIVWLDFNATWKYSYDAPALGLYNVTDEIKLENVGYKELDVTIDVAAILDSFARSGEYPHSGFITMGDKNVPAYDQKWMSHPQGNGLKPIKVSWVVGKARGEIPWFGAIKLYVTDKGEFVPDNSKTNLVIAFAVIIGVPISIDAGFFIYEKMRPEEDEEYDEDETDDDEGGQPGEKGPPDKGGGEEEREGDQ